MILSYLWLLFILFSYGFVQQVRYILTGFFFLLAVSYVLAFFLWGCGGRDPWLILSHDSVLSTISFLRFFISPYCLGEGLVNVFKKVSILMFSSNFWTHFGPVKQERRFLRQWNRSDDSYAIYSLTIDPFTFSRDDETYISWPFTLLGRYSLTIRPYCRGGGLRVLIFDNQNRVCSMFLEFL